MADASPTLARRVLPAALLLLLLAGAVLAIALLRGDPPPVPDPHDSPAGGTTSESSDLPSWVAEENREALLECRRRIAARLGADADAVQDLSRLVLLQRDRLKDLLVLFRVELDLAVRSGDPAAGERVLELFAEALERGDGQSAALVRTTGFRRIYQRAAESEKPELRAAAARFLGHVGGDRGRAAVVPLLEDPDPTVRAAAVRTYGRLADRGGAARLRARFEAETEPLVRTRVLSAFNENRRLRGPDAWAVERAVLEDGSRAERLQALRNVIAARNDHDVVELILPLLEDSSPPLRRAVLELLLLAPDPQARPALEKHLLNEPDNEALEMTKRLLERLR